MNRDSVVVSAVYDRCRQTAVQRMYAPFRDGEYFYKFAYQMEYEKSVKKSKKG